MLEVRDICKTYQDQPLLKRISFTVSQGETIGLLGPSGSGKSTLLRIIAGLEEAASGQILWDGNDFSTVTTYKRNFGLMFQDYALFPHKNVRENVAFGLKMQDRTREEIDPLIEKALAQVNLSSFANRRVTDLSGGEQQRVALARALAPRPKLLMLDEPLGALDRALREKLIEELHELLHEIGIPAIYVTHDQDEAFAIADRLLLLHEGKIVQQGTPEEVYRNPISEWVARFLGLSNLVKGVVEVGKKNRAKTELGEFEMKRSQGLVKPGAKINLLMKPDSALPINKSTGKNCLQGEVTDSLFRGTGYLVRLKAGDRVKFEFLLDRPYKKGEPVILQIDPEKILCLP
jgi:ABC-type Fe3+/spermidine/putrescine transport system ATPase subunit